MKNKILILGSGITGLSAGLKNGWFIYEVNSISDGVCASYYISLFCYYYHAFIFAEYWNKNFGGQECLTTSL